MFLGLIFSWEGRLFSYHLNTDDTLMTTVRRLSGNAEVTGAAAVFPHPSQQASQEEAQVTVMAEFSCQVNSVLLVQGHSVDMVRFSMKTVLPGSSTSHSSCTSPKDSQGAGCRVAKILTNYSRN